MNQFPAQIEPPTILCPKIKTEANALAMAKESSFEYVITAFRDYIIQTPTLDLLVSTKFGVILIQNNSVHMDCPSLDIYTFRSGYELCHFLLTEIAIDELYQIIDSTIPGVCSPSEEKVIRDRIKKYTDQFPFTSPTILDDFFNHSKRLSW